MIESILLLIIPLGGILMSRPVRFGIVGCGVISRWHADSIESIDNAKLIGATDPNTDALHSFIQDYGIKGFATLEEMLKSDEVNAISICTPSGLHAPQAILAANYGVNVIVEKPMAITLREIDEIIRACEKSGIKFSVISQLRFSETVQRVRQAVKEKEIGDVMLCDLYMKYYRSPDYYASSSWRGTWDMDGGGALMNQGIHGIDVLQYIMGPVKSIFGQIRTLTHAIEGEDTATAILEFQNGALGVIEGTTSVYPGYSRRIEIHGDQGSIILEEDNIIEWKTVDGDNVEHIASSSEFNSASDPTAIGKKGHIKQINDFVNAILEDRQPLLDQYDGKIPVEIILGIYESSKSNKKVLLC